LQLGFAHILNKATQKRKRKKNEEKKLYIEQKFCSWPVAVREVSGGKLNRTGIETGRQRNRDRVKGSQAVSRHAMGNGNEMVDVAMRGKSQRFE